MGYGDGAAVLDLALEQRDNASGGTQDISETERAHASRGRIEARQDDFGYTLCGAHYAARVGRFVGGDHSELAGATFLGNGGERPGAEDVVADYSDGIFFHQRYVFEGGGVEDLSGTIFFEESVEERGVVDVAEDGNDLGRSGCDC